MILRTVYTGNPDGSTQYNLVDVDSGNVLMENVLYIDAHKKAVSILKERNCPEDRYQEQSRHGELDCDQLASETIACYEKQQAFFRGE